MSSVDAHYVLNWGLGAVIAVYLIYYITHSISSKLDIIIYHLEDLNKAIRVERKVIEDLIREVRGK